MVPWRCVVRADAEKSGVEAVAEKVGSTVSKVADEVGAKVTQLVEIVDDNILDYCTLDNTGKRPKGKKTLGEKEAEFLDALRSFYYDEKPLLSNEEFDNLKEELLWEGSKVAVLSSTEQRFMEASLAYSAKKPILSDGEYDDLKKKLRKQNSRVVQQGPRCSIRSRKLYSDAMPDYLKMTLLNLPAAVLTLLLLFSVDDLTGFELTYIMELPEPWGIIVVWGFVLPVVYLVSSALTNLVLRDFLILKGPCPNCNTENFTYFGDIFTVKGNREENSMDCRECKAKLIFKAEERSIVVSEAPSATPPSKPKQPKTVNA
ncbi:hypothetical protein WJX81_008269 [Elliptochloris bilobata]|uniref:PGRL1A transmembrane protein n=1 Tax=Elliptochloris bilobata TaxID=381761 RepID=A0AAW1QLK1_9CHLO